MILVNKPIDFSKWYWRVIRRLVISFIAFAAPIGAAQIASGHFDLQTFWVALVGAAITAIDKWARDHE